MNWGPGARYLHRGALGIDDTLIVTFPAEQADSNQGIQELTQVIAPFQAALAARVRAAQEHP
ncbi:MAG: hypothetical protein R3F24_07615 [Gammaproteobacteria bacterium]